MGDTITTGGGIHNFSIDKGYDRRPWRAKDSSSWNTITLKDPININFARSLMGVVSAIPDPKLTPLTLKVEPEAEIYFMHFLNNGETEDTAFLGVIGMRPCPIYLRRGYNQVLLHNKFRR